jgi:hypothetical protein
MSAPKKRGRPPSQATIEIRRIEDMLKNLPDRMRPTEAERQEQHELLETMERARQDILKTFRYGRTTPDRHAYEMASIGDESLIGYENAVLKRDRFYKERATRSREAGAMEARANAQDRAEQAMDNFKDLLSKVEPLGPLTRTKASAQMREDWLKYGNFGDPPSERTLRRWINAHSPYAEHRSGQTSLD